MTDTVTSGKQPQKSKQPFDKNHPFHPDYTGDHPRSMGNDDTIIASPPIAIFPNSGERETTGKERHTDAQSVESAEQNRRAEQQLKQQQSEQNNRSAIQNGNAQAHQQGNRQK